MNPEAWFFCADGSSFLEAVPLDADYWRVPDPVLFDELVKVTPEDEIASLETPTRDFRRCGTVFCQVAPERIGPGDVILQLFTRLREHLQSQTTERVAAVEYLRKSAEIMRRSAAEARSRDDLNGGNILAFGAVAIDSRADEIRRGEHMRDSGHDK